MKKVFAALLFICIYHVTVSQVIPDSLRTGWSNAGLQSFFVDTTNVIDVTSFGAAGDGITNDFPAIASAINSIAGHSGIVFFPPGTYLLNSALNLPDSAVLKGAGSGQTTLTFNLGGVTGNCINVIASQPYPFYPVQGGFQKGSFKIICDSAMNFNAGDFAELREANGAWDTSPQPWADHAVGQIVKVTSVIGDTIFIEHALRIDYDSSLNVEIRKTSMRSNVSIQCMHIIRTDSTAPSVNYGIYFSYAGNCLVRGVEMERTIGALILAEASMALEITGNYFHHAYEYTGSSTKGYGVVMAKHSGENKIENNIFRHLRHAMLVTHGANGNVYSYNYSIEPTRSEFPTDLGGDISLHGFYPFSNLFEGNICQNLMIDQANGPSGPFNTFFRNRVELYGIVISSGTVTTDRNNFVGNDITGTGLGQGQYILTGASHFTYGNNDNGVIEPPGTNVLNDTSYYLSSLPSFWNITEAFPNIGTPNPVTGQNIPSRQRFISGNNFTLCGPDVIAAIIQWQYGADVTIFPNPVAGELRIKDAELRIKEIEIYNVFGERVFSENQEPGGENQVVMNVSSLKPGVYFVRVTTDTEISVAKFVKE